MQFIVAKTTAILGADFLASLGLVLNMQSRSLTDSQTKLAAMLETHKANFHIRVTGVSESSSIFKEFPSLLMAPDYSELPKTDVALLYSANQDHDLLRNWL